MKRLLASLFLCFITIAAHGLSDEDWAKHQPHEMYKNTDIMYKYKWPDNNEDLANFFAYDQFKTTYTSWHYGVNVCKGTYGDNDEGGIVMLMAKKIWKHGVQVCTMQIQAGNRNGETSIWIDFHYKNDFFKCMTFCEYGYGGQQCEDTTPSCNNTNSNLLDYFKEFSLLTEGEDSYRVTTDVDVYTFSYYRNKDKQYTALVQILAVSELLDNGIKLLPLQISVERSKQYNSNTQINSWIRSIRPPKDQSAATTILCLDGYKPSDDNTYCVEDTKYCHGTQEPEEETTTCPSGSVFDESTGTCITCGQTRQSGITLLGICKQCAPGRIFSYTHQDCVDARGIPQQTMRENSAHTSNPKCWTIIDSGDYATCVSDGN